MGTTYILYNPYAGGGKCRSAAEALASDCADGASLVDMTAVEDYGAFFGGITADDRVIVCGGDGTVSRFVNDTDGISIPCDVLYYAAGSGNDFLRDMGKKKGCEPFSIKDVIKNLPMIHVNGESRRFINGVGLGLDGYCCAEVARAKARGKSISYVSVALRAFLKEYSPVNATIVIDGETHKFERVWLVPVMKGKYFGGGVEAAPMQDRGDETVTILVMHSVGRLKALFRFPSFLKGKHPKYKKMITVIKGKSIRVTFDKATDLQVDGDPIENVSEYVVEC